MKTLLLNRTHLPHFIFTLAVSLVLAPAGQQHAEALIAFVSNRDGNDEIYIMTDDGKNRVNLTHHPAKDTTPSWSPDGKQIAFTSNRDGGNWEIYVMNGDGTHLVRLTHHLSEDTLPSWSPDGTKIAFTSTRDNGNSEIYVMNADGTNPVNLSRNRVAQDHSPSWSPDGTKIAFVSDRDGNSEIYVVDAKGKNPVNLTKHPQTDLSPSWSPDGTKIAFTSTRDGNWKIYVMNANGTNPQRLGRYLEPADRSPSWSPDGTKIVFMSYRDGADDWDIYIMNSDGTNPTNLTQDDSLFVQIPNGVDKTLFHLMDKMAAKKQVAEIVGDRRIETHPIVGFLSRFQPEKGAGYYISLARRNPDYLFLVVVPTLSTYAFRDLPPNLVYAGPQKRPMLPLFFNAFDVYCFPSVVGEESFGNAPLEAMACRVPVVAGRFSSLPEVVGDGGILVECETFSHEIGSFAGYIPVDALSEAIRDLISNDEKREKLAENAFRRAQQFDWETTAQAFLSLIQAQKQQQQATTAIKDRIPPVLFSNYYPIHDPKKRARSHLFSLVGFQNEHPLMRPVYTQSVEEGVVLSLMRNHSVREMEAGAHALFPDDDTETLHRVQRFVQTMS